MDEQGESVNEGAPVPRGDGYNANGDYVPRQNADGVWIDSDGEPYDEAYEEFEEMIVYDDDSAESDDSQDTVPYRRFNFEGDSQASVP